MRERAWRTDEEEEEEGEDDEEEEEERFESWKATQEELVKFRGDLEVGAMELFGIAANIEAGFCAALSGVLRACAGLNAPSSGSGAGRKERHEGGRTEEGEEEEEEESISRRFEALEDEETRAGIGWECCFVRLRMLIAWRVAEFADRNMRRAAAEASEAARRAEAAANRAHAMEAAAVSLFPGESWPWSGLWSPSAADELEQGRLAKLVELTEVVARGQCSPARHRAVQLLVAGTPPAFCASLFSDSDATRRDALAWSHDAAVSPWAFHAWNRGGCADALAVAADRYIARAEAAIRVAGLAQQSSARFLAQILYHRTGVWAREERWGGWREGGEILNRRLGAFARGEEEEEEEEEEKEEEEEEEEEGGGEEEEEEEGGGRERGSKKQSAFQSLTANRHFGWWAVGEACVPDPVRWAWAQAAWCSPFLPGSASRSGNRIRRNVWLALERLVERGCLPKRKHLEFAQRAEVRGSFPFHTDGPPDSGGRRAEL